MNEQCAAINYVITFGANKPDVPVNQTENYVELMILLSVRSAFILCGFTNFILTLKGDTDEGKNQRKLRLKRRMMSHCCTCRKLIKRLFKLPFNIFQMSLSPFLSCFFFHRLHCMTEKTLQKLVSSLYFSLKPLSQ